jgi:hypothetical protein
VTRTTFCAAAAEANNIPNVNRLRFISLPFLWGPRPFYGPGALSSVSLRAPIISLRVYAIVAPRRTVQI